MLKLSLEAVVVNSRGLAAKMIQAGRSTHIGNRFAHSLASRVQVVAKAVVPFEFLVDLKDGLLLVAKVVRDYVRDFRNNSTTVNARALVNAIKQLLAIVFAQVCGAHVQVCAIFTHACSSI